MAPVTFQVARIGKPHGIRGEVTVEALTDDPEGRFTPGAAFATQAAAGTGVPRSLTLSGARLHRGIWLLTFEEIPDRTGAESLRETRLLADASEGDGADDGWYEDELLGLAVLSPGGERIGEVAGLDIGQAQDRLVVRLPDGAEALIPFVEAIVPSVDLDRGEVVVDAPPGLLDLARE